MGHSVLYTWRRRRSSFLTPFSNSYCLYGLFAPTAVGCQIIVDIFTCVRFRGSRIERYSCFVLHAVNLDESMSPWPLSSSLKTSMTGDFSRLRIRHVPSVLTTDLSPNIKIRRDDLCGHEWNHSHSRNAAVKLMQTFPSQLPFPSLLTLPGIVWVSMSSSRNSIPCLSRNPTTIFGTPRRKDCAQNLSSFRSNLIFSLSLNSSEVVFNSTQLMGSSFRAGFESQTEDRYQRRLK